jgi:cytidylate kinase
MHIITIDGPASSGKGTVAKIIAQRLGYHYLESGSIYRALGLLVFRQGLTPREVNSVLALIEQMNLEFVDGRVILNTEDVTELIRSEQIGMLASSLAKVEEVRSKLLDFQRSFANEPGLVTDGRDMGSVVFPHALLKVFLTASAEKRAARRYSQLQLLDKSATIESILHDIVSRDRQDSERKVAPLVYDKSFKVLDNSDLTIAQTVMQIISWYNEASSN